MTEKDLLKDPMEQAALREWIKGPLHDGVVTVTFTKVNGESRVMDCTLQESVIPPKTTDATATTPHKHNDSVMSVWSVKDNGWRSFRLDSVTRIQFSI